jgi:hypothetical protein
VSRFKLLKKIFETKAESSMQKLKGLPSSSNSSGDLRDRGDLRNRSQTFKKPFAFVALIEPHAVPAGAVGLKFLKKIFETKAESSIQKLKGLPSSSNSSRDLRDRGDLRNMSQTFKKPVAFVALIEPHAVSAGAVGLEFLKKIFETKAESCMQKLKGLPSSSNSSRDLRDRGDLRRT